MQRAPGNCSSARVSRISFVLLYHWRVAFKVDGSAWRGGGQRLSSRGEYLGTVARKVCHVKRRSRTVRG